MAVIGATLANGGTCPTTQEQIIKPEHVRDVLSLLHSCGFYEYSGQFAFKVRLKKRSFIFTASPHIVWNMGPRKFQNSTMRSVHKLPSFFTRTHTTLIFYDSPAPHPH